MYLTSLQRFVVLVVSTLTKCAWSAKKGRVEKWAHCDLLVWRLPEKTRRVLGDISSCVLHASDLGGYWLPEIWINYLLHKRNWIAVEPPKKSTHSWETAPWTCRWFHWDVLSQREQLHRELWGWRQPGAHSLHSEHFKTAIGEVCDLT